MNHLALYCANPNCSVKVGVKSEHYPYCSKDCQRKCTPRVTSQRQTHVTLSVIAPRAPINRKLGKQNWKRSDE